MTGHQLFVAGAHTDVGKTHVARALIRAARAQGLSVEALKPVVSGFDAIDSIENDPGRLRAALGETPTPEALDRISPWRFAAPLAPPMASRLEARSLPLDPIIKLCRARGAGSTADLLVVEGVGGLMSIQADRAKGLDLMSAQGLLTILVGGAFLDAISHTLTALEVLRPWSLPVAALVVSGSEDAESADFTQTRALVADFAGDLPVIAAPRDEAGHWPRRLFETSGRSGSASA